ncbi:MAG: hypothetical protein CVV03_07225 [Firmicutes bacterium HGW-Firmicutes-8]|nr:MAG: hypothetical protein CVV03_07225 [Firmicutes bacterium HGW-Firmicutes-8]
MFESAKSKIEDTQVVFEQLQKVEDSVAFKALFNSFLSSARAITYALQKDGKKILGFKKWYEIKQEEMKKDELLRFIHEARTEDFHEGKHRLAFGTYFEHFSTDKVGPPPSPEAKLGIGVEGPFWIINEGKPQERRIPIKQGGNFVVQVSISNPPTKHRGILIFNVNPVNICRLALQYLSELVYEACEKFEKK